MKILRTTLALAVVSFSLEAMDLGAVMSEVAQTNPQIVQMKKEFNSYYEALNISQGDLFLPSIDLQAGIAKSNTNYDKPQDYEKKTTNRFLSISATENLFNGFGTVNDIDAKKAALASAAFSYIQAINEVALKAAKVYLDLLRNKELLNVEIDNFNKHKTILRAVQARSRAGVGVVGDLQEITAKTNLAYANYVTQSKNLKAAQIAMNKVLGHPISLNSLVIPSVGERLSYSLSQAINFALTHNPSIYVQKYNVIQARYNKKRDQKNFWPKIDLIVTKKLVNAQDDDTGEDSKYDQLSGGISLQWNLFRGFKDLHTKRRNISLIHVEQEKYNAVKRDLIEEIELAWTSYKLQEKEYEYLQKYVVNAKAKLQTNTKLFSIGKKSLFEFLSSQTDYNSAKEKLINTKYDLIFAKLRVLKALGVLADMVDPNARKEVGITADGVEDYQALNYKADTLPPREENVNQSGSVRIDDLMGFNSYGVVSVVNQTPSVQTRSISIQRRGYQTNRYQNAPIGDNDEMYKDSYDEEYIAPKYRR